MRRFCFSSSSECGRVRPCRPFDLPCPSPYRRQLFLFLVKHKILIQERQIHSMCFYFTKTSSRFGSSDFRIISKILTGPSVFATGTNRPNDNTFAFELFSVFHAAICPGSSPPTSEILIILQTSKTKILDVPKLLLSRRLTI